MKWSLMSRMCAEGSQLVLENLGNSWTSLVFPKAAAGRRARRETDRLCSDNEAGARDGKAQRKNLKN
jgi:hypothetical protein